MKKITAASLALVLLLAYLLTGCGGAAGSAADRYESAAWAPSEAEAPGGDLNFAPSDSMAYDKPEGANSGVTAASVSEKLIYRADLTIETMYFDDAVASLEALAVNMGGFIESSNVSGYTDRYADGSTRVVDRSASYVIRVPSDRFKEAVSHAGEIGSVTNTSTNVENITSQFIDQDARKHSLEVQEERLLAMLEQAEDVYMLVELESRLADVRYEIESIERTLRNWQQQVDYSTVSVYLREVENYTPVAPVQRSFGEKLSDALGDGWSGFVEGLKSFVLGLAEHLPLVLLLLLPGVIVLIVVLSIKRRSKKRALAAALASSRSVPAPQPWESAPGPMEQPPVPQGNEPPEN